MSDVDSLVSRLNRRTKSALGAYEANKAQGEQHLLYNLSTALKNLFKLGLLHWRKGDMHLAFEHFANCAKAYNQRIADADMFAAQDGFWRGFWEGNAQYEAYPAAAAYLSGVDFTFTECPGGISRFGEEGFQPWYDNKLILACLGHASIDKDELARSLDLSKKNRDYPAPLIKLTEFHFEVLTGQWSDRPTSEMLDNHAELYAGLKKLRGDPDLIHGEKDHNDRVVDWLFACVLKRIGWSGRYLHAWPEDGQPAETGGARETLVEPNNFVAFD